MEEFLDLEVVEHFCGVIYKELNPIKILSKFDELKFDIYAFDLRKNEKFKDDVINVYFMKYPKKYDKNELALLLEKICDILQEKYKSTNSLGLIKLLIGNFCYIQNSRLTIDFKMLFRWDGIINRIDLNFLISCAAVELVSGNSKDIILKTPYIPENDNNRLTQKLKKGFSENHAHLKASGYIHEQNIGRYLSGTKFTQEEIANLNWFIENSLAMSSLRKICTVNEIRMLFYKTKILRVLIYKLWSKNCFFGMEEDSHDKKNTSELNEQLAYWEALLSFDRYHVLKNEKLEKPIFDMQFDKKFWWNKKLTSENPENDYLKERMFYWNILMDIKKEKYFAVIEQNYLNLLLLCYGKLKLAFIQGNELGGFDSFKSVEDIKGLFADNDKKNYRSVFHKYYKESKINKLELRIAPKNSIEEYSELVAKLDYFNKKELDRNKDRRSLILYGLVVHFIKVKRVKNIKTYGDQKKYIEDSYVKKADMLSAFIEKKRKFSQRIVGIDTANYEKDNSPEFYVKLYKSFESLKKIYNIHYTFHVGEAFNCLITGIRNVDEVINYLSYSHEDRLGHALALGLKVNKYFKRKSMEIVCTKLELLDNLVWMFDIVRGSKKTIKGILILNSLFDDNAFWLNKYLTKQSITIQEYNAFYKSRFGDTDEGVYFSNNSKSKNFNFLKEFCLSKTEKLQLVFKYDERFYTESRETTILKVNESLIEIVKFCQKYVLKEMIEKRIYIEANPTSNRKISAIDDYEDLPLFKQAKYNLKLAREDVLTSINTDDSALFQTNLSTEYAMVALSLRKKNFSSDEMLEYMERIRETSNLISFVKDTPTDRENLH